MGNIHIQWKQGYQAKCSVEVAYQELEKIRKREGHITAQAIVDAARPKSSPIHSAIFDKNQKDAAEQYYLEQGRKMSRSIEVIKRERPAVPYKAYSTVTVPKSDKDEQPRKVYTSTTEALEDPVMRDEILGNAIREAIAYRRKYAALQELAQVHTAIDEFVANVK